MDGNLLVGDQVAADSAICQSKEHGMILKIEDDLYDYLSCEIVPLEDRQKAWLGQPHSILDLEKYFGEQSKGLQKYPTPGTPSLNQFCQEGKALYLPAEEQKM